MAVYIELVVEDLDRVFQDVVSKSKGRRSGAGEPNVRRPLRGLEVKEDTYAVVRVIRGDGTEIPLFDSSDPTGESTRYSNFMLQSVQDARMEKQQIIETFGDPYIFFFGEAPRFLDVTAVLINSFDFNWQAEWWENYNTYLRGTKLVEMGARCYLFYDDTIVEGYILQAVAQNDAQNPFLVQLQFKFFVTNYANISLIGDPMYPVHSAVDVPMNINVDDNTFNYKLPNDQEMAAEAFVNYLQQTGGYQIQQEIARAKTVEQAMKLQQQYALKELGILPQGANLLAVGKSLFQGKPQDALDELKKGLAVAKGTQSDPYSFLSNNNLSPVQKENVIDQLNNQSIPLKERQALLDAVNSLNASHFDLATALRQGLLYSTPYPGQNIDEFIRNAQLAIGPAAQQLSEVKRTIPLRTAISDNYDEYTAPDLSGADEKSWFDSRVTLPVNGDAEDPVAVINNQACQNGAQLSPSHFFGFGLMNWAPGAGFQTGAGVGVGVSAGIGGGVGGVGGGPGFGFTGAPTMSPFGSPVANGFGGTGFGAGTPQGLNSPGVDAGPLFGNPTGVYPGTGVGYRYAYARSYGATAIVGGAAGGQMGGAFGAGVGGGLGGFGSSVYGDPNQQQFGNPGLQQANQNPFFLSTGSPYGTGFGPNGPYSTTVYQYTGGIAPDGSIQGSSNSFTSPGGAGFGGVSTFGGGANINAVAGFGAGIRGGGAFGMQTAPGTLGQPCA